MTDFGTVFWVDGFRIDYWAGACSCWTPKLSEIRCKRSFLVLCVTVTIDSIQELF